MFQSLCCKRMATGGQAGPLAAEETPAPVDPLQEEKCGRVREVGGSATWSLSSCKPGYGVEQLRDGCTDTYWQSDGQLPHLVNVQFRRKTTVQSVAVYTDYKLDESYTPTRVSIRVGTNFNDLQEIEVVDLQEPSGWVVIPLKDINELTNSIYIPKVGLGYNQECVNTCNLSRASTLPL